MEFMVGDDSTYAKELFEELDEEWSAYYSGQAEAPKDSREHQMRREIINKRKRKTKNVKKEEVVNLKVTGPQELSADLSDARPRKVEECGGLDSTDQHKNEISKTISTNAPKTTSIQNSPGSAQNETIKSQKLSIQKPKQPEPPSTTPSVPSATEKSTAMQPSWRPKNGGKQKPSSRKN